MQPVYVMNEKEKSVAGAVILVLLVVGGLIWGFNYVFPSEETRLSEAKTAEYQLERDIEEMQSSLSRLESTAAAPAGTADLGYTGESLHRLKERLASAEGSCSKLERHIAKLKKSSAVEMQLQAAGLGKQSAALREKLSPLSKRVTDVEQQLRRLVE